MNSTIALSLLLALWCGLSMAKDENDAVVYKMDESSIQAAAAYYASPRSIKRVTAGQGRLIGLNWGQLPLKNYLFTKSEQHVDKDGEFDSDSDEYPDFDPETDPEQLPPPPPFFPSAPISAYSAYGAYAAFPSPYPYSSYSGFPSPYPDFVYQGPVQGTKYYNRYYYGAPRKSGKNAKNCRQTQTRGKTCY